MSLFKTRFEVNCIFCVGVKFWACFKKFFVSKQSLQTSKKGSENIMKCMCCYLYNSRAFKNCECVLWCRKRENFIFLLWCLEKSKWNKISSFILEKKMLRWYHCVEIQEYLGHWFFHEIGFRECRMWKNCHFDDFRTSDYQFWWFSVV